MSAKRTYIQMYRYNSTDLFKVINVNTINIKCSSFIKVQNFSPSTNADKMLSYRRETALQGAL